MKAYSLHRNSLQGISHVIKIWNIFRETGAKAGNEIKRSSRANFSHIKPYPGRGEAVIDYFLPIGFKMSEIRKWEYKNIIK